MLFYPPLIKVIIDFANRRSYASGMQSKWDMREGRWSFCEKQAIHACIRNSSVHIFTTVLHGALSSVGIRAAEAVEGSVWVLDQKLQATASWVRNLFLLTLTPLCINPMPPYSNFQTGWMMLAYISDLSEKQQCIAYCTCDMTGSTGIFVQPSTSLHPPNFWAHRALLSSFPAVRLTCVHMFRLAFMALFEGAAVLYSWDTIANSTPQREMTYMNYLLIFLCTPLTQSSFQWMTTQTTTEQQEDLIGIVFVTQIFRSAISLEWFACSGACSCTTENLRHFTTTTAAILTIWMLQHK